MCPILVIDAGEEQREVAAQISGRECRCINGNLVVIPSVGLCVKGRLLVSYGNGGYAELKDISLVPADGQDCSKFVMEDISEPNVNISPVPEHTGPFRYHCDSIACRRNALGSSGEKYEQEEYDEIMNAYGNEAYTFTENRFTNQCNNVRLIDKGIDVEVERNALFPSTSRVKIDTDCMCPILVIDAGEEQREVAAQISGRECRCINGFISFIFKSSDYLL
ncbi:hypothetical protein WUBG_15784 [Wuchereria bancrofti]|uniref:Uncharacterized protein n=1 Tax=Wuchereria bancrofti TaxID=6293 RepID=J9E8J4_WUCBA|nr:hypothetical protein WUBG_15784 [Wuchereria bancrofti]